MKENNSKKRAGILFIAFLFIKKKKKKEEVVYAELTLSRHRPTHLAMPTGKLPAGTMDKTAATTDGVVYAQIDHTKRKQQSNKRIRTDAPPPPTNQLSTFQQPSQLVVLPDVSQTVTTGNIRETILM